MRNDEGIRRIFTEIMVVICLTKKSHAYTLIKVSERDYNMAELGPKLVAPSTRYAAPYMRSNDPREISIPLNEFVHSIDSCDPVRGCYWIEWVLGYEAICRKSKQKYTAARRDLVRVEDRYKTEIVWILWECLLDVAGKAGKTHRRTMGCLLELFAIRYTPSVKKRRRFVMYFAVAICCGEVDFDRELVSDKALVARVTDRCDVVYKDIARQSSRSYPGKPRTPSTPSTPNKASSDKGPRRDAKLDAWNRLDGLVSARSTA
jgi:hypothetical protein